jgi:hypothetical protein
MMHTFYSSNEHGCMDFVNLCWFTKLFPVIGGNEEETGLEAYIQYICQGMAETAR